MTDDELSELLTLTVEVNNQGTIRYLNHLGQLHRVLGPAVIYSDGSEDWYQSGLLHRTDGPAVIYPSGDQYWYLEDCILTQEEFNERLRTF